MIGLEHLESTHYTTLDHALATIFSSDLAVETFAQIIDGRPICSVYREYYGSYQKVFSDSLLFWLLNHIDEDRLVFLSRRRLRRIIRTPLVGSKAFHLRLIELLAILCHGIGVQLYTMYDGGLRKPTPAELDQGVPAIVLPPGVKLTPAAPPPVHLFHPYYQDWEQYPHKMADMVGYWVEYRLFGGVVLFERGETGRACNDVFIHPVGHCNIFQVSDAQVHRYIDCLLSNQRATKDMTSMAETLRFKAEKYARRIDPYEAMSLQIYRNRYERKIPNVRPVRCVSIAQLDALKAASLRCLQTALAHPASHQADAVIASILTLCTADIVSDGRSPGSWRSHLHGAAAVISHRLHAARGAGHPLAESTLLLWRWYLSIETITLLSGNVTISPGSRTALQLRRLIGHDAIDDLAGFSTALIPIFGDINLLAVESGLENSRQPAAHTDDTPGLPNGLIRERCLRMIENITSMLGSHEPRFRPNIDASLSSRHRVDFAAVDETYHHVALLHLYRRILNLPLSHHLVQASVHQIILRVSAIHFAKGPCPGVAVLQPLFAAGCEACNHADRESVRGLLSRLESQYGMGNVKKAKEFLEDLWAMRDDSEDVEGRVRWDTVMVEKGLDILPY
ncbi:hypothetical protein LOZ58_001603 [Ophidiomyces ophidiicola]|nr:hypothetical protein LOZ58_001603 [Ophidiomyces ophidiicola]